MFAHRKPSGTQGTHRVADTEDLLAWSDVLSRQGDAHPFVVDAFGQRMLQFDGVTIQSQMALDDPCALVLDYTRSMMGFLLFQPCPRQIAMIGLGGGSLLKYCHGSLPDTRFTAVEINPTVIALRDTFGIPPDGPRLQVLCCDGADYVRDTDDSPDVLIVDGFDRTGMPRQLCSPDFYDYCHETLAERGTLVVNLWSGEPSYQSYLARIRDSFDHRVVVVPAGEDANRIVFASKDRQFPPRRAQLLDRARQLSQSHPIGLPALAQRVQHHLDHRRRFGDDGQWLAGRRRKARSC